jgi:hypothetical protein
MVQDKIQEEILQLMQIFIDHNECDYLQTMGNY